MCNLTPGFSQSVHPDAMGEAVAKLLGGKAVSGITNSHYYFGGPGSCFFPHIEDADLFSVNLMLFGDPKIWNFCAPKDAPIVEKILATAMGRRCHHAAEKAVALDVDVLLKAGVNITQVRCFFRSIYVISHEMKVGFKKTWYICALKLTFFACVP